MLLSFTLCFDPSDAGRASPTYVPVMGIVSLFDDAKTWLPRPRLTSSGSEISRCSSIDSSEEYSVYLASAKREIDMWLVKMELDDDWRNLNGEIEVRRELYARSNRAADSENWGLNSWKSGRPSDWGLARLGNAVWTRSYRRVRKRKVTNSTMLDDVDDGPSNVSKSLKSRRAYHQVSRVQTANNHPTPFDFLAVSGTRWDTWDTLDCAMRST